MSQVWREKDEIHRSKRRRRREFAKGGYRSHQTPVVKICRRNAFIGHNFAGPGTKLYKRLNPDGTPKPWSKPVNRVDSAAYRHDLAYARHSDTASRIAADRKMINELEKIPNPTLKERMERAIVKPILATKANFGL